MTRYDVVTLGETMLRFTPANLKRLEAATAFNLEVGGSESNLAVGLARLGLKVLWLSRLTDNPLGRLIERTIAGYGVDTSQVIWTDGDRVGLFFLEEGRAPRSSRVIYDRKDSAISQMKPAELPLDLFRPEQARLLHLSGITPALSPNLALTAQRALKLAKAAGWQVSFDLNYRSRLWAPPVALAGCNPFIQAADILFAPLNDVHLIYDLEAEGTPEQALNFLRQQHPQAAIVLTMGKQGAIGAEPGGPVFQQAAFPAEEVDRVGGGDAFAAGFLYSYLTAAETEDRLAQSLRWGAAAAALKYTIPGDMLIIDRAEVEALVKQGTPGSNIRR